MAQARQLTVKHKLYQWQGIDARGNNSKGEVPGDSIALVKAQLRQQGIRPTRVKRKAKPLLSPAQHKIKPVDIALFTRQLATMVKSGIPLVQSFTVVAEGLENASMRALLHTIREEVAAGNKLADVLRKQPRYFDALYCNLIEAGEQSGALETMLERLALYKEKSEALKSRIRKALNYPLTVIAIALIVTAILLVKVVPQFANTFASFGAELPLFTQYVMSLSAFASEWWLIILIAFGGVLLVLREMRKRSRRFAEGLELLSLKLPVVGHIIEQSILARFTRTLSTTFSAGVPLLESLDSVAGATGNVVYRQATWRIRDGVSSGQSLTATIRATGLFPIMLIQMVSIGEESGTLDSMLDKCAHFHETEVDQAVDSLTAMMEPLIMAILGVLVGGLLVAMYLPVFQIGSVI